MVHFRSLFVVFRSDSPEVLHVALNSSATLRHFYVRCLALYLQKKKTKTKTKTNYDYGQDVRFHHKTKCEAADKILEQRFLKEFKATCKNSGESELKQQKAI